MHRASSQEVNKIMHMNHASQAAFNAVNRRLDAANHQLHKIDLFYNQIETIVNQQNQIIQLLSSIAPQAVVVPPPNFDRRTNINLNTPPTTTIHNAATVPPHTNITTNKSKTAHLH